MTHHASYTFDVKSKKKTPCIRYSYENIIYYPKQPLFDPIQIYSNASIYENNYLSIATIKFITINYN